MTQANRMILYAEQPTSSWSRGGLTWPTPNGMVIKIYDVSSENLNIIIEWIVQNKPIKAGILPCPKDAVYSESQPIIDYVKNNVGNAAVGYKELI